MKKINLVDLFENLENVYEIRVFTQVKHSDNKSVTRFSITRKYVIFPADFHFDKKGILAFDALLKEYGLECDLEIGEHGRAVFVVKEVEYHRSDGTCDFSYFPSQDSNDDSVPQGYKGNEEK